MGVSGLKRTSDTDDEETAVAKKRPEYDLKNAEKSATFTKLKSSNKRAPVKQSEKASKPDRALMDGFPIYNYLRSIVKIERQWVAVSDILVLKRIQQKQNGWE